MMTRKKAEAALKLLTAFGAALSGVGLIPTNSTLPTLPEPWRSRAIAAGLLVAAASRVIAAALPLLQTAVDVFFPDGGTEEKPNDKGGA